MLVKVNELYPENVLKLNKKMKNLDFVLKTTQPCLIQNFLWHIPL